MTIKVLAENTALSDDFLSEHGLSLYIETKSHKLLFDMGKTDVFYQNAQKLNIDLTDIDLTIISHGHYDHGGGLQKFLQVNSNAKIYLNHKAFGEYYSKRPKSIDYIGLDKNLLQNDRITFSDDYFKIDAELEIFSHIKNKELVSISNKSLLIKCDNDYIQDPFDHEQNLIINENGKTILIAGCAHNGIVNIINKFIDIKGIAPDVVIGGFHLFNPSTHRSEKSDLITAIGEKLKATGSQFYTCHCTGLAAFKQLKSILNHKIDYLSAGSILNI